MSKQRQAQYPYARVGKRYVCLQQNLLSYIWLFFIKPQSLPLTMLRFHNRNRRTALKMLLRSNITSQTNLLKLPVFGQIGIEVHRGYRTFDLQKKTSSKVFKPEISPDIVAAEIEAIRMAGTLEFAPALHTWEPTARWYEEALISGQPGYQLPNHTAENLLQIFQETFTHYLKEILLLQPPITIALDNYLAEILIILSDPRLRAPDLDAVQVETISQYVTAVTEDLRAYRAIQIRLTFSHGDFSFVNTIQTPDSFKVIDWESASFRTPLNDLYNFFITELYYERVKTATGLVPEIEAAINALVCALKGEDEGSTSFMDDVLQWPQVYRRLYYVERIKMLLERELSNSVLRVILRSIEMFDNYEEAIGQRRFSV